MTDKEKSIEQSDIQKSDLEFLKTEINKADLESDEKIKLTQEVDAILEKLEKDTNIKDLGKSIQEIKDKITGNQIEKIESKKLNTLNFDEAKIFAYAVFGEGPGTELLLKLSNHEPHMIIRVIALGYHEGHLLFGRQNKAVVQDKDSKGKFNGKFTHRGRDYTTFQLHGDTEELAKKNFDLHLKKGKELCKENSIDYDKSLTYAQVDLVSWLGYNLTRTRTGGRNNLVKLSKELSDSELIKLIGTDIQGGYNKVGQKVLGIGESVRNQIRDKSVATYLEAVAKSKTTKYEKYSFENIKIDDTNKQEKQYSKTQEETKTNEIAKNDSNNINDDKHTDKKESEIKEKKGIKGRFRSLFHSWTGLGLLNKTGLGSKIKSFFTDSFMGKIAGNIGIGKFLKTIFEKVF